MATSVIAKARKHAELAIEFDNNQDTQKSISEYKKAIDLYIALIKQSKDSPIRRAWEASVESYLDRVEELMGEKNPQTLLNRVKDRDKSDFTDELILEPGSLRIEDIIGMEDAKKALKNAIDRPEEYPRKMSPLTKIRGILLYGPPGCGKTELIKAVALSKNVTVYGLNASDIITKYVGESEKRMREVFEKARANQPCIVFIDEFDGLSPGDSDENNRAQIGVMMEIASQLDGIYSDGENNILFIGATNNPWTFHERQRSRFNRRILIDLPNSSERSQLFELILSQQRDMNNELINFNEIGQLFEGYSGRDIVSVCGKIVESLMDDLELAGKDDSHPFRQTERDDFVKAMKSLRPSTTTETYYKYFEWKKEYGAA